MIDRIQNNQSRSSNDIRVEFNKINNDELGSKPLFKRDSVSIGEKKESFKDTIGYLKDSIKSERSGGKNSVNYDFSQFGKEEDSGLKFL